MNLYRLFFIAFSLVVTSSAFAFKSGPIEYQPIPRLIDDNLCSVIKCDKNVRGRIEVPYNVSRDWSNYQVEAIQLGAFQECEMEEIQLPNSIRTIGGSAFSRCPNLRVVEIKGNGLKFIEVGAFSYCQKLETINLPNNVKMIGDNAFNSCTSLKSIHFGVQMTSLGQNAFAWCSALEQVIIDSPLGTIPNGAFMGCSSLKNITLRSVRTIESWAFQRAGLQAIAIGPYIRNIQFGAFDSCYQLVEIYITAKNPPAAQGAFNQNQMKNITVYVPAACVNAYRNHPDWKNFGQILPYNF